MLQGGDQNGEGPDTQQAPGSTFSSSSDLTPEPMSAALPSAFIQLLVASVTCP